MEKGVFLAVNLANQSDWICTKQTRIHRCRLHDIWMDSMEGEGKAYPLTTSHCACACGETNKKTLWITVLQPVAQPYGQVRTDWNQGCIIIDCSLSFPAGYKPFTCSHSVLR